MIPPPLMSLRPAEHRKHGALAATRVPDERHELALFDAQIEILDDDCGTIRGRVVFVRLESSQ